MLGARQRAIDGAVWSPFARFLACVAVFGTFLGSSAAAASVPEGALTELSGPGSCLVLVFDPSDGCTPLGALPRSARDHGFLEDLALSPDGRSAYLTTESPNDFDTFDGPGVLYVLARDPGSGRLSQLRGPRGCLSEDRRPGCTHARALDNARSAGGSGPIEEPRHAGLDRGARRR